MSTVNRTFQTGEDMIMHEGSPLWKGDFIKRTFTLADPLVRDAYEKTYYCFVGSLPNDSYFPSFSRENARSAEEMNIDPNKGMLLMGNTGVGMTTLFQIMAEIFAHTTRSFETINPTVFNSAVYAINSKSKNHVFTTGLKEPMYTGFEDVLKIYGRCLFKDLLIDDTEIYMGKDKSSRIVKGLIYQREKLFPHCKTHLCISFNAKGDNPEQYAREQLIKAYGEHVYSRITSMFNIVLWQGKSFRSGNKSIAIL